MAQDARKGLPDALKDGWDTLWQAAGATPAPALFDRLLAAWSEPQRQYHTLQHLGECLANFQTLAHLPEHPLEVRLALWFHDAIYDLGRHDNEARSADWAREEILAAGLPPEMAERVTALIMATCHNASPVGIDAEVVVDIDLWILGAPAERFDEYERQVRREYGHLPEGVFLIGRMAVLQQFLGRARLFSTREFVERHEGWARENLERSLAALATAS